LELSPAMQGGMTCNADCNEILLGIVAGVATKLFVVNFQVRHGAARLTPPVVATQDLLPQSLVRYRFQPQGRGLWANQAHDASALSAPRNSCRCSPGRSLKNLFIEKSSV